jgi:mRNA-degrading endonuclease RelE of RelBE toxin-antitoxin system
MSSDFPDGQEEPKSDEDNTQDKQPFVQIDLTSEFQQSLRVLAKRYRSIRSDIQVVIQELQLGNFIGNRITGIGKGYVVLKVRVKNQDIKKGKSAGYRLIYQIESSTRLLLLTIYSKLDRTDISTKEICNILNEFHKDN